MRELVSILALCSLSCGTASTSAAEVGAPTKPAAVDGLRLRTPQSSSSSQPNGDAFGTLLAEGRRCYADAQWEAAIDALAEFVRLSPRRDQVAPARFLLAEALVQVEQYDEAREHFAQLLQESPTSPHAAQAQFRLGETAMLLGESVQARRLLEQFRRQHSEHPLNAYALPYLARLALDSRDQVRAHQLYVESLRRYPRGPLRGSAQVQLALLEYNDAEYAAARRALQHIVQMSDGTDPHTVGAARFWLAKTHLQMDDLQQAADVFLTLADRQDDHPLAAAATYHAAEVLRQLGQFDKARDYYRRLREGWPQSEYIDAGALGELRLAHKMADAGGAVALLGRLDRDRPTSPLCRDARRLTAEVLLVAGRYQEAADLLQPLLEDRESRKSRQGRAAHHASLYLLALARRGLGDQQQAYHLLQRVRLSEIAADLAERVIMARVESQLALKRYEDALASLDEFQSRFAQSPQRDKADVYLVVSLAETGNISKAHTIFQSLQQRDLPTKLSVRAARHLAEVAYRADDLETARAAFLHLEKNYVSDDDHSRALSGLAWLDQKQGDHDSAVGRFEQLLDLFPDSPIAAHAELARAQALIELGRHDDAATVLTTFAERYQDSPLKPRAWLELVDLLESEGDLPRAAQASELLLDEYPSYERRDVALFLMGMIRQQTGQTTKAKQVFQELIQRYPSSSYWSDGLYRLAELAVSEGNLTAAEKHLSRLIRANQDSEVLPHALYLRGRVAADEGRWSAAEADWLRLQREYSASALDLMARVGVAESLYQQQKLEQASPWYDELVQDAAYSQGEVWAATVQLRRAQILVARHQWLAAIRVAETIEPGLPDFVLLDDVNYLLGRCHAARGSFTRARQYYRRVVQSTPTRDLEISAMASWMIGETFFHQQQYQRAITAFAALNERTSFPRWQALGLLQTGKCQEKLGELALARKTYSELLDRFSKTSSAADAAKRLRLLRGLR